MKQHAPYGSWPSAIKAESLTKNAIGFGQIQLDGDDIYWSEWRPSEKGRIALVKKRPNQSESVDLIAAPFSAFSRVHEYGGASFCVHNGNVWFVDAADQNIYRVSEGEGPRRLTQATDTAFGDFVYDVRNKRLIAVAERKNKETEPDNFLVSIDTVSGDVKPLVEGADFYANPRLSPDCLSLCWLEWNHPNMPWDGTDLKEAALTKQGDIDQITHVAGGASEAIFQPEYAPAPDGRLHFVSDRTGFWNIYRREMDRSPDATITHLAPHDFDFGMPLWNLGMRSYAFAGLGDLVVSYADKGEWKLGLIYPQDGQLITFDTEFCDFGQICSDGTHAFFIGGRSEGPNGIIRFSLSSLHSDILAVSVPEGTRPKEAVSIAELVAFENKDGETVYAYYYPPTNRNFDGNDTEKPPLIVKSHGGPSGQTGRSYSLKTQFWTSRGFGLLDVNYSGSTGFGRAYRQRLEGQWGIKDVEDCIAGAQYMVACGKADGARLIITGGSAGGYTTLCALTFHDVFKAGCSAYGIGDLTALANDTHKFESRYLDRLVGTWPEDASIYRDRSPQFHAEQLECPVIFLQGKEDRVVPPNQAENMVEALRAKKVPVALRLYEGEGHGFRSARTIQDALHSELGFYAKIFGFKPSDEIPNLHIENLDHQ